MNAEFGMRNAECGKKKRGQKTEDRIRKWKCGMRKEKKRTEDRGQNSEVGMRNAEVEKWRVVNVNTNEKIADSGLKKL